MRSRADDRDTADHGDEDAGRAGRCARRLLALAAASSLLLAGVVGTGPTASAGAASAGEPSASPTIARPEPGPHEVVPSGATTVGAQVHGEVEAAEVRVDGETTTAEVSHGDPATVQAEVPLEPGVREVTVAAELADGTAERTWPVTVVEVELARHAGADRIETAVAISQALHDEDGAAATALLARADDFADALVGAPLAADQGGPLLLTDDDELDPRVAEELTRVLGEEGTVRLLGGTAAVDEAVAEAASELGYDVERHVGPADTGRYGTAVDLAEALVSPQDPDDPDDADDPDDRSADELPDTAMIASGASFPDALAASAVAAAEQWPILLAPPEGALPEVLVDHLADRAYVTLHLVGGTAAVDDGVADQLAQHASVERVHGADRFATAREVAATFRPEAEVAALASGADFPDALAGGVHAASQDAPVLLTGRDRLPEEAGAAVAAADPSTLHVYGGTAAVGEHAVGDALRRLGDQGDLGVEGTTPAAGAAVDELDTITVAFDEAIDPEASTVLVEVGGRELTATIEETEATRTLTVRPDVPLSLLGASREVVVAVRGASEDALVHHRAALTWRAEPLSRGDTGRHVADLQQALAERRFWHDGAPGTLDGGTHHAVVAAQKTFGLTRDGTVDGELGAALAEEPLPQPRSSSGRTYEVDLTRQTVTLVEDGQVRRIFDASAGHGEPYQFEGSWYVATTTTGHHPVVWQYDGVREAARGELYRPKYYDATRGIAIHGFADVPPYPASAGCIRVTHAAMDEIWRLDPGTTASVWVYPEDFYD